MSSDCIVASPSNQTTSQCGLLRSAWILATMLPVLSSVVRTLVPLNAERLAHADVVSLRRVEYETTAGLWLALYVGGVGRRRERSEQSRGKSQGSVAAVETR